MKHNRHKKHSLARKRLESHLLSDLGPLSSQGTFFDFCVEKDTKNKKFAIAKKRYIDLLEHAEKTIKQIKDLVDLMEKESAKEQKRSKLSSDDENRNNKINGEDEL
jgi:uncharacterized protein (DUF488 family)